MPRVPNPYFAGPPATEPDTFFGRQETLNFVEEALASSGHNTIVLFGQRRIGKTSILHQIAHNSGPNYQAVFFDLQSRVDSPAHDLLYGLAREVANELKLSPPGRTDFRDDPDTFRTIFLPQVYDHLGQKQLLLLLDEFDTLSAETAPAELEASPFMKVLNRITQSENKRIVFLFVVGRHLKDLPSQWQLQILRIARVRQIGLLRQDDTRQLIVDPVRGLLTYQEAALERIWSLTNGHPYYTQLLCYENFSQAQRQEADTVTAADVDRVIDDAINAGQSGLGWFWNEAPALERFALYNIGQLATNGEGVTLEQLIAARDAQRAQVDELELRALPDQLVDREILRRDPANSYHFAVELVRRWIIRTHSLEEVTADLSRAATDALAEALFETGRAAYRAFDTSRAIDYFSQALSIDANYVDARLWLARAYVKADDLLAAINEFVNVVRFGGPQQREAQLGLIDARGQYGQQLEEEGKIEEAIQQYQRVLEFDPQHELANERLSEIFRQQADQRLTNEGLAGALPLYAQAMQHSLSIDLQHKIKKRLEQYGQTQAAAGQHEEAQRAGRLATTLMSEASEWQETLLRVQLERGRLYLDQHDLEAAADIYRSLLAETADDVPWHTIENDILRYSQQQEELNHWPRAETALLLLIDLFPDNNENRDQLTDSLCRQAEFLLNQDDFSQARLTYQRAEAGDPKNQTLPGVIRAGFRSYRRARAEDKTVQTRHLVEAAMLTLLEILGNDDALSCQWLSETRTELGHALQAVGSSDEAQVVYQQALDGAVHLLQLATRTGQAHHFDDAAGRCEQTLANARPDQAMVDQIKATFNSYRHQQENILRWNHARRTIETLSRLFPQDVQVKFWFAEMWVSQADWHLQRAIPDLNEARNLARHALDVPLPLSEANQIIERVKRSFQTHSLQQEQFDPPNWKQAEQMMNKLVGLLPGDVIVHDWLAETRIRQGDWYLALESGSLAETRSSLSQASEAYERALRDMGEDRSSVVSHIKNRFRAYQKRQEPSDPVAAFVAMQTLSELLVGDEEVRRWLTEAEAVKEAATPGPSSGRQRLVYRLVLFMAVSVAVGALCIGLVFSNRQEVLRDALISLLISTATPTPTGTSTPTATAVVTSTLTPTASPTATETATSTSWPITSPSPTTPAPPPMIVQPTPGASFQGTGRLPQLMWQPLDGLDPGAEYRVELEFVEDGQRVTLSEDLEQQTSWQIPEEIFRRLDAAERQIRWTVTVVNGEVEISKSEPMTFTWDLYLPPQLLIGPGTGEPYAGVDAVPPLEWEPVEELGPDDYYQVELQGSENDQLTLFRSPWLKDGSWQVPVEFFTQAGMDTLEIEWQVDVAHVTEGRIDELLSPQGETSSFRWQRIPLPEGQGLDIAVNPGNDSQIFAVLKGKGIYKSDNGGIDWRPVSDDRTVETVHLAPADPSVVYAGNFHHVLRSEDGGETWQAWRIPPEVQVYDIVTAPDRADVVFIATEQGVLRSGDGGRSWSALHKAGNSGGRVLNKDFYNLVAVTTSRDQNRIYAVGEDDQIYWRGTDDANSPWRSLDCNLCGAPIHSLAVIPDAGTNILLAGSTEGRLAVGPDTMGSWSLGKMPMSSSTLRITVIAVDPNDPNLIYAGTGSNRYSIVNGQGLYVSENGGQSWQHRNAGWAPASNGTNTYVQGIALSEQAIFIAGSEGVFRSDDSGLTWRKL